MATGFVQLLPAQSLLAVQLSGRCHLLSAWLWCASCEAHAEAAEPDSGRREEDSWDRLPRNGRGKDSVPDGAD